MMVIGIGVNIMDLKMSAKADSCVGWNLDKTPKHLRHALRLPALDSQVPVAINLLGRTLGVVSAITLIRITALAVIVVISWVITFSPHSVLPLSLITIVWGPLRRVRPWTLLWGVRILLIILT